MLRNITLGVSQNWACLIFIHLWMFPPMLDRFSEQPLAYISVTSARLSDFSLCLEEAWWIQLKIQGFFFFQWIERSSSSDVKIPVKSEGWGVWLKHLYWAMTSLWSRVWLISFLRGQWWRTKFSLLNVKCTTGEDMQSLKSDAVTLVFHNTEAQIFQGSWNGGEEEMSPSCSDWGKALLQVTQLPCMQQPQLTLGPENERAALFFI